MKRILSALVLTFAATLSVQADDGFRSLFNGKDLTGWDGNPELWSVKDGCITGKTTGPEQLAYNQFLIWRGGVLKNFELRAKVKQAGNNTGIQYRSREIPEIGKWSVGGYQCDIHPSARINAMVYGEKIGGFQVQNGQSVVFDPDGKRWITSQRKPVSVDVAEWHEYTIVAQGNHLIHKIDGQVTIDLLDFDPKTQALEGLLAFQIHRGPAMTVQIKDVMLKDLPDGGVVAFDKAMIPADAKLLENKKAQPKGKAKKEAKAEATEPIKSATAAVADSLPKIPEGALKWLWYDTPGPKDGARCARNSNWGRPCRKAPCCSSPATTARQCSSTVSSS